MVLPHTDTITANVYQPFVAPKMWSMGSVLCGHVAYVVYVMIGSFLCSCKSAACYAS